MPGNWAPRVGILSEFDARPFAGTALYDRGGADVVAPATWGRFEDVVDFLNGRSSQAPRTFGADLQASWTTSGAAGTIVVGIAPSGQYADHVYLESSAVDFAVLGGSPGIPVLGFDTAGHGLVTGAAPYRRYAPNDWQRGNVEGAYIAINPTGAPPIFFAPASAGYRAQSVPALLRTADAAATVETLENDTLDPVTRIIRWGLDATGRVWTSVPTSSGTAAVAWLSPTFRARLGFSGAEVPVTIDAASVLTAADVCPGVLIPTRSPRRLTPTTGEVSHVVRLTSGNTRGNHVARWNGWRVEVWLGGSLPALGNVDEVQHFLRRWLPYVPQGGRCVLYREWGDERLGVLAVDGAGYSAVATVESNGRRGRVTCSRAAADAGERALEHEGETDLRSAPLVIELDEVA